VGVDSTTISASDAERPPRILLAEDDPNSRDMLVRRLAHRGYSAEAVADGEACLARIDQQPPDLLLLDIQMPGMVGLEVLRRVRTRFSHDALPVILVTALGDSDDIVRGLEAGANDYVVKPVNLPVLLARMSVGLKIRRSVQFLMEAERQRVLVAALGEACHQLSQPSQAVMMTLEAIIRVPPSDPLELARELRSVLEWTGQVGEVIHRLQEVGTLRPVPFTQRMELLDRGSPPCEGERPIPRD